MSNLPLSTSGCPPVEVSVIIPTYNRGYILREALESALEQSYHNYEILIVDDGSSDNTREIVESFKSIKIRYIRHERNHGCSAAYNTGINEARGPVVAFLDSDDVWKPNYIERQVNFLYQHPEVDVVFCNTEIRQPNGLATSLKSLLRVFPEFLQRSAETAERVVSARQMYLCLLEEVPIKPTAAVIRRAIFDRVGLFDEAWPSGTDWDLFLRLSRGSNFGYIDEVLVIQRRFSDATHQKFLEKDKQFLLNVFLKEKATLGIDRDALRGVNRGISGLYNSLAWSYLQSGRGREALSTYYQGFKETLQPYLLKKLASAIVRICFHSVTKTPERQVSEKHYEIL